MSNLANMQLLVSAAKKVLDPAMKRLEQLLPKAGVCHYSLSTSDRELKVTVSAGVSRSVDLSRFSLSYLPGCHWVMVLHGVTVDPAVRHQGVGGLLHNCRLDIARAVGATTVMCTILSGNSAEKSIIMRAGWRVAIQVSPQVELWSREL